MNKQMRVHLHLSCECSSSKLCLPTPLTEAVHLVARFYGIRLETKLARSCEVPQHLSPSCVDKIIWEMILPVVVGLLSSSESEMEVYLHFPSVR